jgi:hypothetical protein
MDLKVATTEITYTHPDYDDHKDQWEFHLRSYLGGEAYKDGNYLVRYLNEDKNEYARRIDLTPIRSYGVHLQLATSILLMVRQYWIRSFVMLT